MTSQVAYRKYLLGHRQIRQLTEITGRVLMVTKRRLNEISFNVAHCKCLSVFIKRDSLLKAMYFQCGLLNAPVTSLMFWLEYELLL